MSHGVVMFKEERVSIFRLPSISVSSTEHYLDTWKEKIWVGNLQIKTNETFLTVELIDPVSGAIYAQSKVQHDYNNYVRKCVDSSRGYALKLINEKDNRYTWVGMVFHDRVSAFNFFSNFQDYLEILKNKNKKYEISNWQDMKLQQGQKITINIDGEEKQHKPQDVSPPPHQQDFSEADFQLNVGKKKKLQQKQQQKVDFDFLS